MVSPDGKRVVFIRSRAGDDPINCLYVLDLATGDERLIADPVTLLAQVDPDDVPAEERARRERMRESAVGRHDLRHRRRGHGRRVSRSPAGCSSPV